MLGKTLKAELDPATVKMYTDLHLKIGLPFEVTLTNYTTRLKSAVYDIHFMKNAQSNRTFAAYAKIKKDVILKPIDDVNPAILKYYQSNFKYQEIYADKIYNVDLKSAYATVLYNDGFLSDDTFCYIKGLPKMDRLVSVGMLAGKKNIFQFDKTGKIVESSEIVSETSRYFFYAVQRTYEIIDHCKKELGNDFLFSWVDGIYFKGEENGKRIQDLLLTEYKFLSSFEELHEFDLQVKKDCYHLTYLKDGKLKLFNIPMPSSKIKQDIYNYLLTKKYKQNETAILSLPSKLC